MEIWTTEELHLASMKVTFISLFNQDRNIPPAVYPSTMQC